MSKYNFEYRENDYKTPPELYNMVLEKMRLTKFGVDTCCTDENIPAEKYFKYGEKDGLKEIWGNYAWCNPPFNECKKWIEKAYNENMANDAVVAMLLPVRTETRYWHDYILNNPRCEIQWLCKGYKFLNKDNEEMGVFKNALAIVYFWATPF